MNSLQRINFEYIRRISSVFDGTIKAIRVDDNDLTRVKASSNEQENVLGVELADQLELLKGQVSDFLSLTFEEERQLSSETRRWNCEAASRNEELVKLQHRLRMSREERRERCQELEKEFSDLNKILEEKLEALKNQQDQVVAKDVEMEQSEMRHFNDDINQLQNQRDGLSKQLEEQMKAWRQIEEQMKATNSSLALELAQTNATDKAKLREKMFEMQAITSKLEMQRKRRAELEEHFARVDENNAAKKREEEALQRVAEIMIKAQELLDNGATAMQKLYRGMRDRAIVEKMKKASKKKGKGKKGGKKK
jgi:chromosome segregation ATPase